MQLKLRKNIACACFARFDHEYLQCNINQLQVNITQNDKEVEVRRKSNS